MLFRSVGYCTHWATDSDEAERITRQPTAASAAPRRPIRGDPRKKINMGEAYTNGSTSPATRDSRVRYAFAAPGFSLLQSQPCRVRKFGLRKIRRLSSTAGGAVVLSVLYIAFQRVLQLVFLLFRSTESRNLRSSYCATLGANRIETMPARQKQPIHQPPATFR